MFSELTLSAIAFFALFLLSLYASNRLAYVAHLSMLVNKNDSEYQFMIALQKLISIVSSVIAAILAVMLSRKLSMLTMTILDSKNRTVFTISLFSFIAFFMVIVMASLRTAEASAEEEAKRNLESCEDR